MTVTTVLGSATADSPPERVHVGVVIRGEADTTIKAKAIAKAKMAELYEAIRRLDAAGVPVGEAGLATRFSVRQIQATTHAKPHYEARFDATVTSRATNAAAQIFDQLTSIDGAVVETPSFAISEALEQQLRNQAFIAAVAAAKARFQFQCEVIGFDPSTLEIVSWDYERGSRGSSTSGKLLRVTDDDVTVTGANVQVKCDVRLTYDLRARARP